MQFPVTVDGVDLSTVAWDVVTRTGWRSMPGVRAATIEAGTADGVLVPDRRAPLQAGQIAFSMWVQGDTFATFTRNLDTLMGLFATQRGCVPITMDCGDAGMRVTQARTLATITPEHVNPGHAKFTAVMEIPSGKWQAPARTVAHFTNVDVTSPTQVACGDPTAEITDTIVLIRDPGTAVRWWLWDANTPSTVAARLRLALDLPAPIASNRSLVFDLGAWRVYEIARPASAPAPAWFDSIPTPTVDHTAQVQRFGPMFGDCLLPLLPGATPLPPRTPGIKLDPVDGGGLPTTCPHVSVALRGAWL